MLIEGVVGVVAIITACALHPGDYYAINTPPEVFNGLGLSVVNLPELQSEIGEVVAGRTGGAVSLAVGMAQIFSGLPGMRGLMAYWYHFAIMFEAVFILTTIDSGTRIGRFLIQEFGGRVWKPLARTDWLPGNILATVIIVLAWVYFIWTGNISTIWPMFGVANQLLACTALCVGTTIVLREAPKRHYALVTLLPLCFLSVTTLAGGIESVRRIYLPMTAVAATRVTGWVNAIVTTFLVIGVTFVIVGSARRWLAHIRGPVVPLDAPATS